MGNHKTALGVYSLLLRDALATESTHWAETEFEQLDLGDARLDKRARILMERLAADPMASVPKACRGWGETMAAYRFFDNDSIDWRAILAPHWQQTQKRMEALPVILCLQDTTELDFNGQGAIGLGPLSYDTQRGMYLHPTYAVTPQREPLGILDAWMWAREKKDKFGKRGGPRRACAGSRATSALRRWRRVCRLRAWCMWPTAKPT